jgi:hypothetical protein
VRRVAEPPQLAEGERGRVLALELFTREVVDAREEPVSQHRLVHGLELLASPRAEAEA